MQVWQNYDGSNKKSSGAISEVRGFEAFVPNTIFETRYKCSDDSCAVHQGNQTTPHKRMLQQFPSYNTLLICLSLTLIFRKSSPYISAQSMMQRSRCWCGSSYQDWRSCCQFQTSHRCHVSLNSSLAEEGFPAQLHPLPRGITEKGKSLKMSKLQPHL